MPHRNRLALLALDVTDGAPVAACAPAVPPVDDDAPGVITLRGPWCERDGARPAPAVCTCANELAPLCPLCLRRLELHGGSMALGLGGVAIMVAREPYRDPPVAPRAAEPETPRYRHTTAGALVKLLATRREAPQFVFALSPADGDVRIDLVERRGARVEAPRREARTAEELLELGEEVLMR